jgi:subfamily B ATP-binding cassette protein MsbA
VTSPALSTKQLAKGIGPSSPEEQAVRKSDVFRLFRRQISGQKKAFFRLGLLLIVQACVIVSSIWLVKVAVDDFFASHTIRLLVFSLFLAMVVKSLLDFLINWTQNLSIARVRDAIVSRAYSDLLHSPLSFHIQERSSRKYGWVLGDTNNFVEAIFGILHVWIRQPVQIVSSIAALAYIDWKLTVLGLLAIPLSIPFVVLARRRSMEFVARRKQLLGRLEERIAETTYGIRIVKAFGLEARELGKVNDIIDQQRRIHETNAFYLGLAGPIMECLGLLGLILVLLLGTQSILSGSFTTGTFTAFLLAFFNIYRPLKDVSRGFFMYQVAIDAGRRLVLLQHRAQAPVDPEGTTIIDRIEHLECRGVRFSYSGNSDEGPWTLKDIDLRIDRGETILMTGVSGAGKSTLCDLMFRLFRPQRGTILVNGFPVESLHRDSYRKLFAMCSQETIIFNDTLLENIRIARPEASREDVLNAARVVQLPDKMLERLDAPIGDRGNQLSGGERQRLALARAVLCKPEFLLLDEALNNVDPETEARIWKGLREELPQCTMLVVSHRWLDLHQYDRLLVLDGGRLIEDVRISNDRAASAVLEKYREAARLVSTTQ